MARARNIKPGFFSNDALAEIDPLGRLLFIGLWTIADREGRLEDRPRKIRAEVLPYDDCDADRLLDDLAQQGFLVRYEVGGQRFIQVVNFGRHQNPHQKETASTIPAPCGYESSTGQEPEEHGASPADSLNLIPDTPIPQPMTAPARAKRASGEGVEDVVNEADQGSKPFEYIVALCEATGADVAELSDAVKGKQGTAAKRLRAAGMTPADVRRCARWLTSQSWRTHGIDLFTIEKERGAWEMAGKPVRVKDTHEAENRRGIPA